MRNEDVTKRIDTLQYIKEQLKVKCGIFYGMVVSRNVNISANNLVDKVLAE